ncbi:MAG: YjjG family noncanonical pyrimidine nucleotidase [Clostridia bacterium]|nr:YjjG family noncanonical pyrimidine nucleotidase [Clostridia bacterium]
MKKYTTLLLDIDETVLDFKKAEAISLKNTLMRAGITPTQEIIERYHFINDSLWKALERGEIKKERIKTKRFELFYEEFGFDGDPVETAAIYVYELSHAGFLLGGAREFLEDVQAEYDVYAVTNGIQTVQQGRFDAADINKYFKDVFISERIGYSKPDKRYFDYVLSVIPETDKSKVIVIGDSLTSDIKGAYNSGLDSCWFDPDKKESTAEFHPTYIAHNYADILNIIANG